MKPPMRKTVDNDNRGPKKVKRERPPLSEAKRIERGVTGKPKDKD